ncbi:response regulator [Fundidesulfovibrio terrae]|uniref:response regulator n=1 Tax=Fundidesulfovibrio terrae TaxID=2922866 RepID=UPI001FAFE98F|nr:response regulator [Fundidesulfovibrio terrae]
MTDVLVIDDERPTLAMFELLLQAMGYKPKAADSGERGLELFEQGDFPIVLTDIKMRGLGGMEVLSRIKASRPETEVIVITGHGDVELALAALNLKAADFIDKPISQEALASALRRAEGRISRRADSKPVTVLRDADGVTVLDIAGNLSTDLDQLAEDIDAARPQAGLLITVSECASINGAGIEGLSRIIKEQTARGGASAIACKPENFRRVFEAAGLTALASLHESEEDGLKFLLAKKA